MVLTLKQTAERVKRGGVAYYQLPGFALPKAILHAFSTRVGGVSRGVHGTLNLGFKTQDDPLRVRQNRDLFARTIGIRTEQFVHVEQVHGDEVIEAKAGDRGRCLNPGQYLGRADALVTREPRLALMVQVADCLPVLFHDPVRRAIGVAHAGWRGTVNHVAVKTLLHMGEVYGTNPSDVRVGFGPCIGPCCYEVGEDVYREFAGVFPWVEDVFRTGFAGNRMLDLAEANARQLIDIGVKRENLVYSGLCTVGKIGDFYSHRAEGSVERPTGRFAAVIMLV